MISIFNQIGLDLLALFFLPLSFILIYLLLFKLLKNE